MPFGAVKMRNRDRDRDQSGDNVVQLPEYNVQFSFLFDGEHDMSYYVGLSFSADQLRTFPRR